MPTLIVRADATLVIGAGHVMRCIALAQAWVRAGGQVIFITLTEISWVKARLAEAVFPVVFLRESGEEQLSVIRMAVECFLEHASPAEFSVADAWVVLDGYHFCETDHCALRRAGYGLLVLDDHCHLPSYSCDLLLNQNVGASLFDYKGDIGASLLGPNYVLLREEFIANRGRGDVGHSSEVKNILLTLGGGDASGALELLAPVLQSELLQGRNLRIVTGGTEDSRWRHCLALCKADWKLVAPGADMVSLIEWADFCITAGGSTCWELCSLHVPFAVVCIAENQRAIVDGLITIGAACPANIALLASVFASDLLRRKMVRVASEFVDGRGADRVVAAMMSSVF